MKKRQSLICLFLISTSVYCVPGNEQEMLIGAIKRHNVQLVHSLITQHRANINALDVKSGMSPLEFAVSVENESLVADFINIFHADVNVKSQHKIVDILKNSTPLHAAAMKNNIIIAAMLINAGADVNAQNNGGLTPLHWAVRFNAHDMTLLLLKNGANPHAPDKRGNTPVHFAEENQDSSIVDALLSNEGH